MKGKAGQGRMRDAKKGTNFFFAVGGAALARFLPPAFLRYPLSLFRRRRNDSPRVSPFFSCGTSHNIAFPPMSEFLRARRGRGGGASSNLTFC